ncbi:DUF4185 domain-containing protein [Nocardia donostiensis]|uniref:Carbohydrate-binding domain protein n=1 Tax=Nocardia donostiensis TaxID=1538463 RepID=A0A1V2TJU5_9NOCA|nr:DUF4185 domain-containing protein [Nocardia donostiensis]ONM49631.1 carbohydrate-binding domain protein [Nocardia donostiensis]OQS13616.1 carbohydrate-binding domain protein [Nocardia donostiensis]OQS19912.1 carbohydrate-binding domain protein [Nocardia donostiensis]
MNRSLSAIARIGALAAALTLVATGAAVADPNNVNPIPGFNGQPRGLPALPGPTQAIFQVTGMDSPNRTHQVNVLGTDLGVMWDDGNGTLLTAFGDSAGLGIPNLLAGSVWAWTSNVIFRSHTKDPSQGIFFDSVVPNPLPSPKIPGIEISLIPTAGIAVGGVQYLSLMSVRGWGDHGRWTTNFVTLAASGDGGQTWAQLPTTRRANVDGHERFQQNAFVKEDGYVYRYGTPAGRNNPGFISRVQEFDIANIDAYEYWDGTAWKPGDAKAAAPIVEGVAELSVQWNEHLGQYVMLTTDPTNSVVMRTAAAPQGPWSPPRTLVDTAALPSAYAPMIFPYQTGSDLYFLLTVHHQYNVLLMRTPL